MQQVKGTFLIKGIISFIFSTIFALNLMTAGSLAAPFFVNSSTDSIADFTSIQDAINAANPGDEIIVQPGIYVENIRVTKNVTIYSESGNPSDTILQAANNSEDTCSILSNDVTLRGFSIKGSTYDGVHFFGASDCHIENNRISNNSCGIDLCLLSSGNKLDNNEISGSVTGISLGDSWYNILSNNKISNCESGISLFDSPNNELEKNLLFGNKEGISLIGESNGNNLTNNMINSNKKSGLNIYGTSNNLIYNNYFNNSLNVQAEQQVLDANSWNITPAEGTNIVGGPYFGGNFWAKPDSTIYPEGADDSNLDGIYDVPYNIEGTGLIDPLPLKKLRPALLTVGNDISGNNTTRNFDFTSIQDAVNSAFPGDTILISPGIYQENIDIYVTNLTVIPESGNPEDTIIQAASNSDDIFYIGADGIKISGFSLIGPVRLPSAEIYLNGVKNCQIENNWLFANSSNLESGFGIRADLSNNNIIRDNTLSENGNSILLYKSAENQIINNIASDSIYGVWLDSSINNILNGNSISDSKIGFYLKNSTANILSSSNLFNNTFSGINLLNSDGNTMNGSNAMDNNVSIVLRNSSENLLKNNTISDNSYGIRLHSSNNNTLHNNRVIENEYGIYLKNSSDNTLLSNWADSNGRAGIYFGASTNNQASGNRIVSNLECGFFLLDSNKSLIYNNYFNNTNNIYFEGTNPETNLSILKTKGTNIINGVFLGGNFWATPSGTGFSQTQKDENGDGISDVAYILDNETTDYLPLVDSNF